MYGIKLAPALSPINAPYSLFFAEDGPRTPFPFNVTYFAAFVAIFAGLASLGLAIWRTGLLPPRWRVLPLVLGLSSLLPVWGCWRSSTSSSRSCCSGSAGCYWVTQQ